MTVGAHWVPVVALLFGAVVHRGIQDQQSPDLQAALATALPATVDGLPGHDLPISEEEAQVAAFTDYALRLYQDAPPGAEAAQEGGATQPWASIYLGFYQQQTQGRTIHSPKNCLPGSGWQAISSTPETLVTDGRAFTVNRYVLQNGDQQALVLYWYQGRGRVAHSEYLVKWDLLRDAVLKRRTDEALVRIVVPILESEEAAFALARELAVGLMPDVERVLPL